MMTFKVLAALLDYPNEGVVADLPEMQTVIAAEQALPADMLRRLGLFIADLESQDLLDAQEQWVDQFDRTRSLSLNLFEHIHGDSRDRGQAMVDLQALYQTQGLELSVSELPDYLPLFLEFLSLRPKEEALGLLGETGHVVAALVERLQARSSPYSVIMEAISVLAATGGTGEIVTPDADDDVDATWAEEPVDFGAGSALAACGGGLSGAARLEGTGR